MTPKNLLCALVVMLISLCAAPAVASPATGTRSLPSSVECAAAFDVVIEVSGCGRFGQVVENLPEGFTYLRCESEDIKVKQEGRTLKFTFLGDSVTFVYSVKAPTVTVTTSYVFQGLVKDEDKNQYPIPDSSIAVLPSSSLTERYALTIVVKGGGSTIPGPGTHYYDAGEVVQIRAQASPGWIFDHWDGDVASPESTSTTVVIDGDKTVTAKFTKASPDIFTLVTGCEPKDGGTVSVSPAAADNRYEAGASIELTAKPSQGYIFRGWSGDVEGITNPIYLVMDSDKRVMANFQLLPLEKTDSLSVSGLSIYPIDANPGEQITISITVTNSGDQPEDFQASLYVNGQLEKTHLVNIPARSSQNITFFVSRSIPGNYSVSLAGQEGQFVIKDYQPAKTTNASAHRKPDTGTLVTIVAVAGLAATVGVVAKRLRRER